MSKSPASWHRTSFAVLLGAALAALAAAFTLSLEKIHLMNDPDAVLSCSFNVILNCAGVMETWQASVFWGIPNMFIGLVSFPVLVAIAVAALWGGARFKKGFLLAMNIGVLTGTIFAYWLFFQSVYVIEILCPWCLVVTTSCTLMLAAVTHLSLSERALGLSRKADRRVQAFLTKGYHQLVVAGWIVLMVALVVLKFGTDLLT